MPYPGYDPTIRRIARAVSASYNIAMPVEVVRRGAGKKYSARVVTTTATEILRLLNCQDVELSLALVGNSEIRKLNAKYRGRDYATDVLSFPAADNLPGPVSLLGDVVISVEKARAQAKERGRSLKDEMTTLLIHGIVHLLGYDHERSARDERAMRTLERKIYRSLCGRGYL
jgi:probable rRNA maturation factor